MWQPWPESKGGVSRAVTGESKSERDWIELYHLAEQYFHEHGDLLVPGDYVCYGKRLGRWIGTQRAAGKGKRGQLTESQIRRLEAIGMSWDPVEEMCIRDRVWTENAEAMHGKCGRSALSPAQNGRFCKAVRVISA